MYDIVDNLILKDQGGWEKQGENWEDAKLGGQLHKAFMAEIGEEMCQAEVAHHANNAPEYLLSRPEKHVSLYKKALAIGTEKKKKDEEAKLEATRQWEEKHGWSKVPEFYRKGQPQRRRRRSRS
mgnify:CR=1 FL=1